MVKKSYPIVLFLFFLVSLLRADIPIVYAATTSSSTCDIVQDAIAKAQCLKTCSGANKVWTAVGCISTDPQGFISSILTLGIGLGGGIAFLLILFGGFQILTSAGNPEQLQAGREVVTSAITGLLLIIFSIFLLRLIGVNIFGIPDFK